MTHNRVFPGFAAGVTVYAEAAAFYAACVKEGYTEEASEFAEWFLEAFDYDLED